MSADGGFRPARGPGKRRSSLEWLASGTPGGMVLLDSDDNDPVRFMHGWVAGLQTAGEKLHIPAGQQDFKTMVTEIINRLSDTEPITLVLDDYHVITMMRSIPRSRISWNIFLSPSNCTDHAGTGLASTGASAGTGPGT